ncbi:ubiquitin carboxyl-terminal hydrolase 2 [Anoplophora glabripennis]|nr:ubiquitin carboxyl-terminal hydrolase 2 [Anoplophora glabripennis]
MDKKPVPLYIGDNLRTLNLLVKDNTFKGFKKVDRLPALANRLMTELLQVQNDQEKCYIISKRYLNLMDIFFKLTHDKSFAEIRYRSDYNKVQSIVKELEIDLAARYKELAQKQAEEITAKDEQPSTSTVSPYIKPTVDDAGAGDDRSDKSPIFDKIYITPVDLFNALMKKTNLLIVDIRPAKDFTESFISAEEGHIINIPGEILVPGLSANTLGQRLEGNTQEIWNQRDTFDVIVLMDWDTDDFNFAGSKIERLRICIVEWDFNRVYRQDPVILLGGLKEFLEWYPTEVTNSFVFLSQTNSELEDILTLDEVSYPEAGSAPNRNINIISSFTDVNARIKRDFGDAEEGANVPTRSSRSEGQLPKDFYSAQEGVSPYRSLSQESLPKDYFSVESITEPPPTTIIESEPHKEVIFEKDIEQPSKDEEAEIKNAIEGDRTLLLYKARALKPKIGQESPRTDPRDIIIKNLIEENKELFKPPAVDRSYKPFQPIVPKHQGMVGDGYTGLRNLRNNCYMNCMLQCLKVLPLIKSMFVTSNSYIKHIHKQPPVITTHFATVMKTIWEGTAKNCKTYYPQSFFNKVYELNPVYSKGNHEDTFEFFIFLFNHLSEDCSFDLVRPKVMTDRERSWYSQLQGRSSYFVELFYYQLKNTKICWCCQKPNLNFDSDSSLMLPVPVKNESVRLEALLKEYLKENLVSEYSCSECKSSATIVNRKAIVIDPEILVIVLKRYVAEKDGTFRKNELEIEFPMDKLEFGNSYYRLYSIPQHSGSMSCGHYYASILLNDERNTWVLFNDERVTPYNCAITDVPGIKSSCVGFFYVRQGPIKND